MFVTVLVHHANPTLGSGHQVSIYTPSPSRILQAQHAAVICLTVVAEPNKKNCERYSKYPNDSNMCSCYTHKLSWATLTILTG